MFMSGIHLGVAVTDHLFFRIGAGFALGQQFQVRATPTVIVNGWRFASPPSLANPMQSVEELLDGRRLSWAVGPDS
jgi:hypothetical protein